MTRLQTAALTAVANLILSAEPLNPPYAQPTPCAYLFVRIRYFSFTITILGFITPPHLQRHCVRPVDSAGSGCVLVWRPVRRGKEKAILGFLSPPSPTWTMDQTLRRSQRFLNLVRTLSLLVVQLAQLASLICFEIGAPCT